MRIAALALLLATAGLPASGQPQTTEAAISARLNNQPLYLRGYWRGSTLNFDSSGHLKGRSDPVTFTLSGFDLERASFKHNRLVLLGRRIGLEFDRNMPKRVPLNSGTPARPRDLHVKIDIDAPADGDYSHALDAIFVNGLAEGFKASGIEGSDLITQAVKDTPLGRLGYPDDIASVVAFLASDDARWITGSLLQAAGGLR